MTNRALAVVSFATTVAIGAVLVAQKAAPSPSPSPSPPPARQKIVIIGASVSAGFEDPTSRQADGTVNRSYRLDTVLKKVWSRQVMRAYNRANMAMFMAPRRSGGAQVKFAKQVKPDLVLGVDFPFWFGYGSAPAVGRGVVNKHRLARQKQCFGLLDGLQCPILLGDYPDMRGASTKMLPRAMIPNKATIKALNERLHQYAAGRPDVHVVSLAKFVRDAVSRSQTYAYGDRLVVFPKNYLLQSDRLHATRLGMVVMTTQLLAALPKILAPKSPLLTHRPDLRTLVRSFSGLEDELPKPSPERAKRSPLPQ